MLPFILVGVSIIIAIVNIFDGQKNLSLQKESPQASLQFFFMPAFLQSPIIALGFGLSGIYLAYQTDPSSLSPYLDDPRNGPFFWISTFNIPCFTAQY